LSAGAVTVVIPTKDRFEILLRTVACVLRQSHNDVRLVVVDDGSRDETSRRLSGLDDRIAIVRQETSQGVSQARNRGLEAVVTPWVAFLDDDDLWAPGKLARQLDALRAQPGHRWACSATVTFSEGGAISHVSSPPRAADVAVPILRGNVVPGGGSGCLVATDLVRAVGGFDPRLSNLADWDCWLRLAQQSPVAVVASCDVGYRSHPTSMAHAVSRSEQELVLLRSTHDALYRAAGVEVDQRAWFWFLQSLTYAGESWVDGARRSARLALRHGGGLAAVKQPLKNLHAPTMQRHVDRVTRERFPVEYRFARTWLDEALLAPSLLAVDA
jgi:glycosyltransferase involved in cell wall biosynthesis